MNTNLWNLYKQSDRGKKAIATFDPEVKDVFSGIEAIKAFESQIWDGYDDTENAQGYYFLCLANFQNSTLLPKDGEPTREEYSNFIDKYQLYGAKADKDGNISVFSDEKPLLPADKMRRKASDTSLLSLYLYYNYTTFKPMLLPSRFDIVQRNCDLLGIEMPEPPRSKGYKDDCMYYYDICQSWNEFQQQNGMTDAELCACVYDFASMLVDEHGNNELPSPTNVWLTGGSGGDFAFLDSLGKDKEDNHKGIWACNERTRRGDIIIMYCLSPRSYIHSVWRANSGGIFNPFDYYQCRTTICNGVRIPNITFNDLKSDSYFASVPIVRKNLQGINGWEFTANDYKELQRLIKEKGGDVSTLPQLFEGTEIDFGEIKLEKDVEEKILITALKELGYNETDWTRQLELKAGRSEKAIPDFVFFAKGQKHFESAPLVIEAKLDMSSVTEQQKAFRQALSYARMLRSKLMAICDKERIIVYKVDDYGAADRSHPLFENHWKAVFADSAIGAKLKQVIGAEIVKAL